MSSALPKDSPRVTIAEFDAFLAAQLDSHAWELVDGEIVAMTNPSADHAQIASNIGHALKAAADARGCQVLYSDTRIQRSADSKGISNLRPDVVVRCGPLPTGNFITDPVIVVEVLSPSTMEYDRGGKTLFYMQLPSARHILLVYQDEMRVEHFMRTESGWDMRPVTVPADEIAFDMLDVRVPLSAVYFGVFPR